MGHKIAAFVLAFVGAAVIGACGILIGWTLGTKSQMVSSDAPAYVSDEDDQRHLDGLWQSYPMVTLDMPISDELQFRRTRIRKQIRDILRRHPSWPVDGPEPGHSRDFTRAHLRQILVENEDYDQQH